MGGEITKVYRQEVPALRFIGKKYGNSDRVNGNFGKLWGQWFQNNWFDTVANQAKQNEPAFEGSDAYTGLMRDKNNVFEYWIGIFMPENTPVPESFDHLDFPKGSLGVCWIYGRESEVYGMEPQCADKLKEQGFELQRDREDTVWCFERYTCPRFTTPDEKGKIILDFCFYVK